MLQKIQLKHQRRREANANERKRIKELNEAIKRLKETTHQSSSRLHQITRQEKNEEKCKKSKKLTKLAIIKSAIQHIKLMQHHLTLQDSNIENGFTFSYSVDQRETLPSIMTFPTVTSGESPVGGQELSEDDKLSFPGGTFHSLEMKTEEELEIVNESEGEHEREYVIVEDAEKYQILPVEHQYQIHSNVVYFQGSYSAL